MALISERAQLLIEKLFSVDGVSPIARDLVVSAFQELDDLSEDAAESGLRNVAEIVLELTLRTLRSAESDPPSDFELIQQISGLVDDVNLNLRHPLGEELSLQSGFERKWRHRLGSLSRRAQLVLQELEQQEQMKQERLELKDSLERMQSRAHSAMVSLGETQQKYESVLAAAKNAAGDLATANFEMHFSALERRESRTAMWFRAAAIAGIGAAVVYAVLWATGIARVPGGVQTDAQQWIEFASHLTIVTGAGALTAYLARQPGQHRRIASWAQSVAVQLKSFPALASTASDEVKDSLYIALANRVLAAPPEKGVESESTGVTTAQALEVMLAAMKKIDAP